MFFDHFAEQTVDGISGSPTLSLSRRFVGSAYRGIEALDEAVASLSEYA